MTDFDVWNSITHSMVTLNDDVQLKAHGLEKTASYIIRKNGVYYEAIKGGTSTGTGKIAYGGVDNADGTDGTDGSAVIQAALDNLTAGRIHKEAVVCKDALTLEDTVTVSAYTLLDLSQAKILGGAGLTLYPFYINGISNVEVIGGLITGDGSSPTTAQNGVDYYDYTGIQINNSTNIKVHHNSNIGCWGAVNVYNSSDVWVSDNYGYMCAGGWQSVADSANIKNVHFIHNDAHEFGDDAISFLAQGFTISDFSACHNSVDAAVTIVAVNDATGTGVKATYTAVGGILYRGDISHNRFTNLGQSAIICNSMHDTTISHNNIYNVGQTSATQKQAVLLGVATTNPCTNLKVCDNFIDTSEGNGITAESVTDSRFIGNTIENMSAGVNGALYFWGSEDNHITGNTIRNNTGNGILFGVGNGYNTLIGNKLYSNTLYGVNLGGFDYNRLIGNDFQGNGSGSFTGGAANDYYSANRGYVTEAWGTVNGTTPIAVTFAPAMKSTPTIIIITSNEEIHSGWNTATANGFNLTFTAGGARTFNYYCKN